MATTAVWNPDTHEMLAWGGEGTTGHREVGGYTLCDRPHIGSPTARFCPGSKVTFSTGDGYDSYEWSPGGSTDSSMTVTASGPLDVSVHVTCGDYTFDRSEHIFEPPPGDVNEDGLRNTADLERLVADFFASPAGCPDVHQDGQLLASDLAEWIRGETEGWN